MSATEVLELNARSRTHVASETIESKYEDASIDDSNVFLDNLIVNRKLSVLQLISSTEQKSDEFRHQMDNICRWLYCEFLPPNSNITAPNALENMKKEFKIPRSDIPSYFISREQDYLSNLLKEWQHSDDYKSDIYEIIYEIVTKMIYIHQVNHQYPMICFPSEWSTNDANAFLECFGIGENAQQRLIEIEHTKLQEKEVKEATPSNVQMDQQQREQMLSKYTLAYHGKKTMKQLKSQNINKYQLKCNGCAQHILSLDSDDSNMNDNDTFIIWKRQNDSDDEFIFHNEECVLLRKYKEAIRQYVFECECLQKRPSTQREIPGFDDVQRLFYLYRDRKYLLDFDKLQEKDELPPPKHISRQRKRQLAALYLHKQYEAKANGKTLETDGLQKHEPMNYVDWDLYGSSLSRFCLKQLESKEFEREAIWKALLYIVSQVSTKIILNELEIAKNSLKRLYESHSFDLMSRTIIEHSRFPVATALYLAAFMTSTWSDNMRGELHCVKDSYIQIAINLLQQMQSDHLLAIRLELPTDINGLSILEIAFNNKLYLFLNADRLQPIFHTMWREFEYLSPEITFHVQDATMLDAFKLLLTKPNRFYYTPMGLFLIQITFWIVYFILFLFWIYLESSPQKEAVWTGNLLYLFGISYIWRETQEWIEVGKDYFETENSLLDIIMSVVWIVLLVIRLLTFFTDHDVTHLVDNAEISNMDRGSALYIGFQWTMMFQCMLVLMRLLLLIQVFSPYLGNLIQIAKIMIAAVIKWCIIMFLFIITFTFLLYYVASTTYLFEDTEFEDTELDVSLYQFALYATEAMLTPQGAFYDLEYITTGVRILMIVFNFIGTVFLLNLLIALMVVQYEAVQQQSFQMQHFVRVLNTYTFVNKTAVILPPLNIVASTLSLLFILCDTIFTVICGCRVKWGTFHCCVIKYRLKVSKSKQINIQNDDIEQELALLTKDTNSEGNGGYMDNDVEDIIEKKTCTDSIEKSSRRSILNIFKFLRHGTYCRFCRNNMESTAPSITIDEYFNICKFYGKILDQYDRELMRYLCRNSEALRLCKHCFRPCSRVTSTTQIVLESISFWLFFVVWWIPLLCLLGIGYVWHLLISSFGQSFGTGTNTLMSHNENANILIRKENTKFKSDVQAVIEGTTQTN